MIVVVQVNVVFWHQMIVKIQMLHVLMKECQCVLTQIVCIVF